MMKRPPAEAVHICAPKFKNETDWIAPLLVLVIESRKWINSRRTSESLHNERLLVNLLFGQRKAFVEFR